MEKEACVQSEESTRCDCHNAFSSDSFLADSEKQDRIIRRLKIWILVGGLLYASAFVLGILGSVSEWVLLPVFLTSYLILGFPVLWKAASNIQKGRIFDENFLMAIATIGALAIGQWSEAVAVMLFYQVGELFQKTAVHRSKRSIAELAAISPDYANVQRGETLLKVRSE